MDINNIARKRTYIAHMRTTVTTDYTIALLADSDREAEDFAQEAEPYDGRSVITQEVSLDSLEVENVSDAEYYDVIAKANAQIRERPEPIPMAEISDDMKGESKKYQELLSRMEAVAGDYIAANKIAGLDVFECLCGHTYPTDWVLEGGVCPFCGEHTKETTE